MKGPAVGLGHVHIAPPVPVPGPKQVTCASTAAWVRGGCALSTVPATRTASAQTSESRHRHLSHTAARTRRNGTGQVVGEVIQLVVRLHGVHQVVGVSSSSPPRHWRSSRDARTRRTSGPGPAAPSNTTVFPFCSDSTITRSTVAWCNPASVTATVAPDRRSICHHANRGAPSTPTGRLTSTTQPAARASSMRARPSAGTSAASAAVLLEKHQRRLRGLGQFGHEAGAHRRHRRWASLVRQRC